MCLARSGELDGEPLTCINALAESWTVQRVGRHWLPRLAPVTPQDRRGILVSININDDFMSLEIDGQVIVTASGRVDASGRSATKFCDLDGSDRAGCAPSSA
jgi:hypothetical protein